MKALFVKEYRQSYLLAWLGLLLSAMIAVLYWAWTRSYVKTARDQEDLNLLCCEVVLIAVGVMTVVATAGLLSSEKARGTLPYLLALPVSRTRIWLAKALAGLALVASGAMLLIVPLGLVLPQILRAINPWLYLPDIMIGVLLLFWVTLFCTTLLQRTISVLLTSVVVAAACYLGAVLLVELLGGVLGYDQLLDISLVALLMIPAFLFASWVAFVRGELFQSKRSSAIGLGTLGAGLAIICLGLWGGTSWAYRYQRAGVKAIESASLAPGGAVALVSVAGSPAPWRRDSREGWVRSREDRYRAHHEVLVDLKTGREALVLPGGQEEAVSPDGRLLACVRGVPSTLRVWDLAKHRLLRRGLPEKVGRLWVSSREASFQWSPRSKWLAVNAYRDLRSELLLVRPEGPEVVEIVLWGPARREMSSKEALATERRRIVSWAWSPDESALYTLQWDGRLARRRLPGGEEEALWQPPVPGVRLPPGYEWRFGTLSASPSGHWLAVHGWGYTASEQRVEPTPSASLVISSDGAQAIAIGGSYGGRPVWSSDGRYLYLVGSDSNHLAIWRWREGEAQVRPLPVPADLGVQRVEALPRGSGLLVWGQYQVYTMNPEGRLHRASNPDLRPSAAGGTWFLGFDSEGRMIVQKEYRSSGRLEAVDLTTWTMKEIYP